MSVRLDLPQPWLATFAIVFNAAGEREGGPMDDLSRCKIQALLDQDRIMRIGRCGRTAGPK